MGSWEPFQGLELEVVRKGDAVETRTQGQGLWGKLRSLGSILGPCGGAHYRVTLLTLEGTVFPEGLWVKVEHYQVWLLSCLAPEQVQSGRSGAGRP